VAVFHNTVYYCVRSFEGGKVAKVLIAEDDAGLSDSLEQILSADGHVVDSVMDGQIADDHLKTYTYQLIILDWDLPSLSGVEILKRFRVRGGITPVLILTGKSAIAEKEEGLDAGADDYLTKPFHPRELRARLRALLRRPAQITGDKVTVRNIEFDSVKHEVTKDGLPVKMTALEGDLLEFFMRHPGETFSIESLLRGVWQSEAEVSDYAIYAAIKRLRKKLDSEGQASIISNVHGIGYRLDT
jgi:two-component system, OmpR family, manganese sensing response regulator